MDASAGREQPRPSARSGWLLWTAWLLGPMAWCGATVWFRLHPSNSHLHPDAFPLFVYLILSHILGWFPFLGVLFKLGSQHRRPEFWLLTAYWSSLLLAVLVAVLLAGVRPELPPAVERVIAVGLLLSLNAPAPLIPLVAGIRWVRGRRRSSARR